MWQIVILCLFGLTAAEKLTFDNYRVFRLVPTDQDQLQTLQELEITKPGYSFWKGPSQVNSAVDLMVSPENLEDFASLMDLSGLSYQTVIENVQDLINEEAEATVTTLDESRLANFNFSKYHMLDEIYEYLDNLAKAHPDKVEVLAPGKTYEGRQIKGVKLTFGQNKPGIFIEAGIHAREWITPATTLYVIDQLLNSKDQNVRELAESHTWFIFPSFNPDGYVYTHTKDRLWRKTRKPYGLFCRGADPNRNWGYKWMSGGASLYPCAETHAGNAPFSEIEIKTMSDYIKSISDQFYAYISFHSYSQLLLFPYGHTKEHLDNYDEELDIGAQTIRALSKRYGTKYVTGNIAETIYVASGSSVDWVKGTLHKPITYTYELRDTGRYGFILPANQIIPTGEETMDSLVAMFKASATYGYPKNH